MVLHHDCQAPYFGTVLPPHIIESQLATSGQQGESSPDILQGDCMRNSEELASEKKVICLIGGILRGGGELVVLYLRKQL